MGRENKDLIDLKGRRFGNCVVIDKADIYITKGGIHVTKWNCLCDCGNKFIASSQGLREGTCVSCGCVHRYNFSKQYENIGQKYNNLTIIDFIEPKDRKSKSYNYLCRCDCGNEVPANLNKLKTGHTKSCGCLKEEYKKKIGDLNRKYKHTDKRIYSIFQGMHRRCEQEDWKRYHEYGGRGIKVCSEWDNFDNFYDWAITNGYDTDLTLDRIDVNGNYEPSNCRWITNRKQQFNRRNNRLAECNGEIKTATEWAETLGVTFQTIIYHLNKGRTIQYIKDIKGL